MIIFRLICVLLILLSVPASARMSLMQLAGGDAEGGGPPAEANQEAGYITVGSTTAATNSDRAVKFTTDGAMTVSYGYYYCANSVGANYLTLAVFDDSSGAPGTQVGSCSSSVLLDTDGTGKWYQVTWASGNPSLSASTVYHVHRYTTTTTTEYYDTGGAASSHFDDLADCAAGPVSTASTRLVTMTVSNYDAH